MGSYSVTYLIVVSKNPAETLHISLDHLSTKFSISLIHVEFVFVVALLPARLPQPTKGEKLNSCQSTLERVGTVTLNPHTAQSQVNDQQNNYTGDKTELTDFY